MHIEESSSERYNLTPWGGVLQKVFNIKQTASKALLFMVQLCPQEIGNIS
jgi:hypothetical protein